MIPLFNLRRIASTLRIAQKQALGRGPILLRTIQPVIGVKEQGGEDWYVSIEIAEGWNSNIGRIFTEIWEKSPWSVFHYNRCVSGNS